MVLRHALRCGVYLIVLGMAGWLATGCSTVRGVFSHDDSPAVTALLEASEAINASRQAGATKHYPDEIADLEQRYQVARSAYHTGHEKRALEMAQSIIDDADALHAKAMEASHQPDSELPSPPPPNQQPVARLLAPSESDVNATVLFDASGSSDQDADTLTYHWDFGDGETVSSSQPTISHQYAKVDNYTVSLRVSDGRGGSDTIRSSMQVISRQTLQSAVLFGYKQAALPPAAEEHLAPLVKQLREAPNYQVEIIGHTDSVASENYNLNLSRQRAEAVRDFLLAQGIAEHQIVVDWRGETEPIASNDTEDGRLQNRRTEITLRPMPTQHSQRNEMTREAMTIRR